MAVIARSDARYQEVRYSVGADGVREAIMEWLVDKCGQVFNDSTTLEFTDSGGVVVTTRYEEAERQ